MKQLSATGYLSNRGRQIAASCLINELEGTGATVQPGLKAN